MLGRFKKWSAPQGGVAFLVEIEALIKAHGDFWRAFDRSFASTLLSLVQYAPKEERIEVWGGVSREGPEPAYLVLLTGSVPSSEVVGFFYGQLRQQLPDGALIFAGSPPSLPPLLPIYAVTDGQVFRCAVTEDGTSPTLRVLLSSPDGPVIGQIPAVPVNLAAMLDKVQNVSLLVADLSEDAGAEGFTEDGDRVAPGPKEPPIQSADDLIVAAEVIIPEEPPPLDAPFPTPLEPPPGPAAMVVEAPMSPSGSLRVVESDVVSVQEVAPLEEDAETPIPEVHDNDSMEEPIDALMSEMAPESVNSMEIPTLVRTPAPSLPPTAQGDGVSTLIDVGDADIASARVVSGAVLNGLTDSELRLILTSAPLEETCQKLAAALHRQPAEIARVYALASGAPAVPGPESTFALRARTVASVVGWILAPRN